MILKFLRPLAAMLPLPLFAVSGFAALVYQVLWVRELGLLFGATAQAAALTIAIFFAGIALGSWFWGRFVPRVKSALLWFGVLEVGVGVAALAHFALVDVYHTVYPAVYALAGHSKLADTLAKMLIACTLLLPAAFLMGGTLPFMAQHAVRGKAALGRMGSLLYAVNTAGAAAGALAAGFLLPQALGFRDAYLLAVGLDLFVGCMAILLAWIAWLLARAGRFEEQAKPAPLPRETPPPDPAQPGIALPPALLGAIALGSGAATLAAEVLWTRLFAQVLQNSVYTYSLVLSTFLVALTLGAGLANLLCRVRRFAPETVLGALLLLSALALAATPWQFHWITGGGAYVGVDLSWRAYVLAVGMVAAIVMLVPGTILGAVLPYLLRLLQSQERAPGEIVGRLVAVNTTGAILGALLSGFVLLPLAGAYWALLLAAAVYLGLLAALLHARRERHGLPSSALAAAGCVLLALVLPRVLAPPPLGAPPGNFEVIELREGAHATAAVIATSGGNRAIRVNTYYTLGSSRAQRSEQNQTVIPMLTHPEPRSVFFLGMGTGITAGAALAFPVERVVTTELLPEVIALSRAHFGEWTNGLYDDPRSVVLAADGRNSLSRSPEQYDLIISDLFTPWKAGTGNLYTLEHYAKGLERLRPGGLYVQWIPLYQVSLQELGIIARTMDDVFPQVLLWRGDLFAERSIVALVGQREAAPLDPSLVSRHAATLLARESVESASFEAMLLRYYAGNVTTSGLFDAFPVNTDNNRLIEFLAPRTHRLARTGETQFLIGEEREAVYSILRHSVPPETDPYLALLTPEQLGYVQAGHNYSRFMMLDSAGEEAEAQLHLAGFLQRSPPDPAPERSPSMVLLE